MKKLLRELKRAQQQLEKTICKRDDLVHSDVWDCHKQREKFNEITDQFHYWATQIEDMIDELEMPTEEECRVVFS